MSTIHFEDIRGFAVATVKAGLKASGKEDVGLIAAERLATAAGVFTRNAVCAAPVKLCRRHLVNTGGYSRAVLVNAGCANACTGSKGWQNALRCATEVGRLLAAQPEEILVCSTGVIGKQLPMEKMLPAIAAAVKSLGRSRHGAFARAIMTTDLVPKEAAVSLHRLGISIAGVGKGSGMIAPNMATMLAFILTDADIAPHVLQRALSEATAQTFNCVTVDGDTSTNDTALALASAAASRCIARSSGRDYSLFAGGLREVCASLAEQIARDGEGATKLLRVCVRGGRTLHDARRAARAIAESPLVKTAIHGCDPNWGRILAAAGRSGAMVAEEKISVRLCGRCLFRRGRPLLFDSAALTKAMRGKEVTLEVDLGLGHAACEMLTCDLSYDYIRINAEYHT